MKIKTYRTYKSQLNRQMACCKNIIYPLTQEKIVNINNPSARKEKTLNIKELPFRMVQISLDSEFYQIFKIIPMLYQFQNI